jgi:ribosomal protein S18
MTTEETLEGGGKELSRLREHELKIKEIAQKMVKNNRERETIVGQLRANFDKNDEYIREILNEEINKMTGDYYGHVIEWWNSKMIEQTGSKLKSNNIWLQFKKDNEPLSSKIDCNIFKDILSSFITEKNIIKPRTKTGAIEILNYSWKTQTTQPTESPP